MAKVKTRKRTLKVVAMSNGDTSIVIDGTEFVLDDVEVRQVINALRRAEVISITRCTDVPEQSTTVLSLHYGIIR